MRPAEGKKQAGDHNKKKEKIIKGCCIKEKEKEKSEKRRIHTILLCFFVVKNLF